MSIPGRTSSPRYLVGNLFEENALCSSKDSQTAPQDHTPKGATSKRPRHGRAGSFFLKWIAPFPNAR